MNKFSFEVYSYDDYDTVKNKYLPSKKIYASRVYNLDIAFDNFLFNDAIKKFPINQIHFKQIGIKQEEVK